MRFINRQEDIKYLQDHFGSEPNSLLFVYGPKSSGKSTLLNKVVESLDKEKFVINFMDLRGVLIYNFKTFLNVFFPKSLRGKAKQLLSGLTVNTGIFAIDIDEESLLEENAFKIMEKRFLEYNKKGIKPIIIIDEIQDLKGIYVDKDRMLINELYNLFVRLTKVLHSAHVILATSDSYFIEEIYNNAKLMQTTKLYFVDHFEKESVIEWLEKENFTKEEISNVWESVGGCPWEITEIITYKNLKQKTVKESCEYFVNYKYGQVMEFISVKMYDEYEEVCLQVIKEIAKKGYCTKQEIKNKKIVNELVVMMVDHDFWFYRVDKQEITANSKSLEVAFSRM